ncbi:MAG: tRNA glutamyl-Q(34) synthetase GluQRS [Alphaproteobacteria bacterium]|nr:tRNA glutamyl-Q(34) synthetase GluQRS [Alphaproteobacteria bacterium]
MTITRFAPSPTGELHLGHAYSALLAYGAAERSGGRFILRIEDIDAGRCREEHVAGIYDDLAWLGLDWVKPVRRQSEHFSDYRAALDRLAGMELLYPCFCTRKDIAEEIARSPSAPHGPDGAVYPGTCRRLAPEEREQRIAAGEPYALRLDLARAMALAEHRLGEPLSWRDGGQSIACDPNEHGDVVLARKDTPTSYHLAVTLDDAAQGVTLVTRGKDLFTATHVHRLLQALLDLPTPDYLHHDILLDEAGRRLSKRDGAPTLKSLRGDGASPDDIRRMIGLG